LHTDCTDCTAIARCSPQSAPRKAATAAARSGLRDIRADQGRGDVALLQPAVREPQGKLIQQGGWPAAAGSRILDQRAEVVAAELRKPSGTVKRLHAAGDGRVGWGVQRPARGESLNLRTAERRRFAGQCRQQALQVDAVRSPAQGAVTRAYDLAFIDFLPAPDVLGRPNERIDQRPFGVESMTSSPKL
jgi:hypothetical protein